MSKKGEKITVGTMFWILVICAMAALVVLFFFSNTVHALLLATINWIGAFIGWGPFILGLVFFGIMILQSLAVPIPSELCLLAGGVAFAAIYDTAIAILVSATIGYGASILGAIMLFYLGRKGGRPLVVKFLGESDLNFVDNWFQKWGVWAVLFGRLLPVIFYDPISLVSGATDIKVKYYMYATLAGTVPRVIFYCGLGAIVGFLATETQAIFDIILIIIVAVGLLFLLIYWLLFQRYARSEEAKREEAKKEETKEEEAKEEEAKEGETTT
ncbi:MAG: TVP38/TMEM64 family protein [Candidatus Helarchaeota archaeon]|nr:TVP38/TMEM64 family protein [Candidatus Helarchaeota archaeon]